MPMRPEAVKKSSWVVRVAVVLAALGEESLEDMEPIEPLNIEQRSATRSSCWPSQEEDKICTWNKLVYHFAEVPEAIAF